jgi:glycosyltransferase involved in cell wall biosynthesis
MPKLSVLLPTYNAAAYLAETLDSLFAQTEPDFELIVLDDHSTDATVDIVRARDDPRLRLHVNAVNLGTPGNINIGLAMARGVYIARMDHDDLALPDRLRLQAAFLDRHPEVTLLGGQIQHFQEDESVSDFPLEDDLIKARLIAGSGYIANPTTMFRAEFVRRHRIWFDPNLYLTDDLGFIFDCVMAGARLANLPDLILRYRVHPAMTSMNLDASRVHMSNGRLMRRMLPAYFPGLSGVEVERLLDLFRFHHLAPRDMASLTSVCYVAGRAIGQVNDHLGQNPSKTAEAFAQRLMDRINHMMTDPETLTMSAFREVLEPAYLRGLRGQAA